MVLNSQFEGLNCCSNQHCRSSRWWGCFLIGWCCKHEKTIREASFIRVNEVSELILPRLELFLGCLGAVYWKDSFPWLASWSSPKREANLALPQKPKTKPEISFCDHWTVKIYVFGVRRLKDHLVIKTYL